MRGAGALLLFLLLPTIAACGGGSAFPGPTVCPTATPLAAATGRQATAQYLASVRAGVDVLAGVRETLRSAYPGDKFSRDSQFRVDFATYADSTVCGAQNLVDLRPPSANAEAFDAGLDGALEALIEHTRTGRKAVQARNVTDYRAWYQGVDEKIAAVRTAAAQPVPR